VGKLQSGSFTLAVSGTIFAVVAAALLLLPGHEVGIYPLFGLVFLWNDWRREEEAHILFVFFATLAAFLLMARLQVPAERIVLGAEASALLLISFGLSRHRQALTKTRLGILGRSEGADSSIRDSERELRFYRAYETSAQRQADLRKDLTHAAKSLGSTMDTEEVRQRMSGILETRYPGSSVAILPGQVDDPLVRWSLESRTPVLVKDMHKEDRFGVRSAQHSFRSALVVPMNVMKQPYGFLRLENKQPGAYTNDDLRTVDLIATLASLTLENIHLYDQIHNLAAHDALTQLLTRRTFDSRLNEELLRAGRAQAPLSLIMCDVDHFKKYNDTYGHQAGDELLRTVSRLLGAHTRPVDAVARYGGEEFALILPNMVRTQAIEMANRIRLAVQAEPFMFKGQRTTVTMSFGVSAFPVDATSQSQLIRVADERMYQSKHDGRNRVTG
jgi:diguanylate cyclase (GGDEF)-like protein